MFTKSQLSTISGKPITVYHVENLSATTLYEWARDVNQEISKPNDENHHRIIYDLSHPGVSLSFLVFTSRDIYHLGVTPTSKSVINRYLETHPELMISLAIVLSPTTSGMITQNAGRRRPNEQIRSEVFMDMEMAEEWVSAEQSSQGQ